MIAKYYGKSYTLQTLRQRSFITREGVSTHAISDAAETNGVRITFYIMRLIICLSLLLLPVVTFAQQQKYADIMNSVQKNIRKNYDTVICLRTDYNEFIYIDSTKEIMSVVHLDALSRRSQVGLASKYKNISEHLYSGSMYGNHKNYGYSSAFELFYGGNTYSYQVASYIMTMHTMNTVKSRTAKSGKFSETQKNKEPPNTPCAIYTRLKTNDVQYEVKDTVYNSINCFLLIKRQNSMFTLDDVGKKDKKQREASNWDTCYETSITVNIVNKSNYAILLSDHQTSYRNTSNEIRTFYLISKYEKTGNYYYEKFHEFKYPRLFLGFQGGFNDRDLYTLIIKEAKPEFIPNPEEEIKNLSPIRASDIYSAILKPVNIVDNNIREKWNSYWK
jgi:N-acetylmuramoyl-L-alanine amidase